MCWVIYQTGRINEWILSSSSKLKENIFFRGGGGSCVGDEVKGSQKKSKIWVVDTKTKIWIYVSMATNP